MKYQKRKKPLLGHCCAHFVHVVWSIATEILKGFIEVQCTPDNLVQFGGKVYDCITTTTCKLAVSVIQKVLQVLLWPSLLPYYLWSNAYG